MKTKTMTTLLILIALAMFATPVSAKYLDDDWFIDKAIVNVESDYTELEDLDIVWNGVVTSGFEFQFRPYAPLHKHASIAGSYGFANSGYVEWDGRVYVAPWRTIYETSFKIVKPRSVKLTTTFRNTKWQYVWNGNNWVQNTYTVTVVDGRTYMTYDNPN